MSREHVVQTRLSDSEYEPIETIVNAEDCSESEAVRKCIRAMRVYSDDELLDMIQSEEFEAITRLMGD
jgi:hypothetical protein